MTGGMATPLPGGTRGTTIFPWTLWNTLFLMAWSSGGEHSLSVLEGCPRSLQTRLQELRAGASVKGTGGAGLPWTATSLLGGATPPCLPRLTHVLSPDPQPTRRGRGFFQPHSTDQDTGAQERPGTLPKDTELALPLQTRPSLCAVAGGMTLVGVTTSEPAWKVSSTPGAKFKRCSAWDRVGAQ